MFKYCPQCEQHRSLDDFGNNRSRRNGLASECKECCRKNSAKYKKANPEKTKTAYAKWEKENREYRLAYRREQHKIHAEEERTQARVWRKNNPEEARARDAAQRKKQAARIRLTQAKWRVDNPDYRKVNRVHIAAQHASRKRERRATDVNYKLAENLRNRLWYVLKGNCKSQKTFDYLGCSIHALKTHLECQFQSGMSWDNYGNKENSGLLTTLFPAVLSILLKRKRFIKCAIIPTSSLCGT